MIPIAVTNAEIPASKSTDDSPRLERTGLARITASRSPLWNARTSSTIPMIKRAEARIYFHMVIAYYDTLILLPK